MRENVYWFFICQNITNTYKCGILLLDSKKFGRNNMDFEEVIKNRYSCKKYSDKKVEKEKLDKILEAGRLAPTAKLRNRRCYNSRYSYDACSEKSRRGKLLDQFLGSRHYTQEVPPSCKRRSANDARHRLSCRRL